MPIAQAELKFYNVYLDWVTFMHYERRLYISKPEIWGDPPYDYATINESFYLEKFAITDVYGQQVNWYDVYNLMSVKIFALRRNFEGCNWLTASKTGWGKYFERSN